MAVDDYSWFVGTVKEAYGLDLSSYKETQMKRRLIALREQKGCHDFHLFFNKMSADPALLTVFLDRMTINVSSFYRNAKRWQVLEKRVLPKLLHSRKRLNVWSAACSTGEEPYTLAILLSRVLPLSNISILATDLDEQVLNKAKAGRFPDRSLQELPAPVKERFFTKKDAFNWEVDERLKRVIRFEKHDMLKEPFSQNFDLIVCRNVLIYFTNEAKEQLYHKFNQALTPDGVLFVGSTEQIFYPEQYGFITEETFFYRKETAPSNQRVTELKSDRM